MRQNKKRDELAIFGVQETADHQLVHVLEDLTDSENANLRYVC